jgi:hypothetical protein
MKLNNSKKYRFKLLEDFDPEFVTDSSSVTVFHNPAVVRHSMKHNLGGGFLHMYHGDSCIAVVPIIKTSRFRYSSGYSGVLFASKGGAQVAIEAASALKHFFKQNPWHAFDITMSTLSQSQRNRELSTLFSSEMSRDVHVEIMASRQWIHSETSVEVTDLPSLLKTFDQKIRNQIKRCHEDGFRQGDVRALRDDADIDTYLLEIWDNFQAARSETGLISESAESISNTFKLYIDSGARLYKKSVYKDGEPVASCVFLSYNGSSLYLFGYTLKKYRWANMYPKIISEVMLRCINSGDLKIEMGRRAGFSEKDAALDSFKKSFSNRLDTSFKIEAPGRIGNMKYLANLVLGKVLSR